MACRGIKYKNNELVIDDINRQILYLIIEGLNNKQMAERLYRNHRTIEKRVLEMAHVLRSKSRVQTVLIAIKKGLIQYEL